ncbi:folate family ECF transporter S component [Marinilactibacillus sp. Marseille-P9653]|uniref:folate family ECF transporter S component n=1 Tax=Marinilactibacillus sp. Marseille-P9653 TaxID=2866583 RepID=UPI001CE41A17|nr:folate family ECF transporter S component [Marinilactibacillus sp. Marseille-P9653]
MQNQEKTVYGKNGKQSNWKIGTIGLAIVGVLIAMNLALSRVGITTPVIRITFAFLPIALIGILFGPFVAGISAALADLLAFVLLGGAGTLFPGFTLSALLTGLAYGLFLHKKDIRLRNIIAVEVVIALFIHIVLNTTWVFILTGNPLAVILPPRLIQNAVTLVVRVLAIWFLTNNKQLRNVYRKYSTAKK